MKKSSVIILIIMIILSCVVNSFAARGGYQADDVSPCLNMTCTGTVDCPIKVQCDTDYASLIAAKSALYVDVFNFNQAVNVPAQQATLQAQIASDQQASASISAASATSTSVSVSKGTNS